MTLEWRIAHLQQHQLDQFRVGELVFRDVMVQLPSDYVDSWLGRTGLVQRLGCGSTAAAERSGSRTVRGTTPSQALSVAARSAAAKRPGPQ